jgi:hypothetical protein
MRSYMNLQLSPNIFQVIKSRRLRGAGDVARTSDRRGTYRMLEVGVGNLRVRDHLEGIRTNGTNTEMCFQKQINRRTLLDLA